MTKLHDLYEHGGQSPWIDDLKRSYLSSGRLAELIDQGIRGMTSNPTIMAKAIEEASDYDEQFSGLIDAGMSVDDAYWEMVIDDVKGALELFRPLYDESHGSDGFVSLEVSPAIAHDTNATIEMARSLHERINQPNLLVKIPATKEGVPAIEEMIAEGRSINVTLIFSLERYQAVIDAYLRGLQRLVASGGDPSKVASVASFFVSRVDTEVDRRLDAIIEHEASSEKAKIANDLKGKAAIAQARLAYAKFQESLSTSAFTSIPRARPQRPLWASTSTKNPAYPDLYYVESLIGPDTVDTMPDATVEAFLDHGKVDRTADLDIEGAELMMSYLHDIGIDLTEVTTQLENEGVASFGKSFDELIAALGQKAAALKAH